ncbi:MAG: glycosyltransferase family 2 protein, partial [Paraclostridium sp.]
MGVSIIILTHNKEEYTKQCIESIRKYTKYIDYEIIVVDNNSTDETISYLKSQSDIKLIQNKENLGFPKGCNQGIEISNKDYDILLLNNDTVVTINYLNNLYNCLHSSEDIGAVGPLTNSASYLQEIAVKYEDIEKMHEFTQIFNESNQSLWEQRIKLIGFCMLIKREVINKVGLLDEIFTPGNFEDDDYSIRMVKEGYRLILCKDTFIHHYGGVSFDRNDDYALLMEKNKIQFENKWKIRHSEIGIYTYFKYILEDLKYTDNKNILEIFGGLGATGLYIKDRYKNTNYFVYEDNENIKPIVKNVLNVLDKDILSKNKYEFEYTIIKDPTKFLNLDKDIIKNLMISSKGIIVLIDNKENRQSIIDDILKISKIYGYKVYKDYKQYSEGKIIFSTLILSNQIDDLVVDDLLLETKLQIIKIDNNINVDENISIILNKIKNNQVNKSVVKELIIKNTLNKEV